LKVASLGTSPGLKASSWWVAFPGAKAPGFHWLWVR
jgi:hypothetical protein